MSTCNDIGNDDVIIEMQGNIIKIQGSVSNIQCTVNKIQSYINSLYPGCFDIFGDFAIIVYANDKSKFPCVGNTRNLYIELDTKIPYIWNNNKLQYEALGATGEVDNITIISGGNSIV